MNLISLHVLHALKQIFHTLSEKRRREFVKFEILTKISHFLRLYIKITRAKQVKGPFAHFLRRARSYSRSSETLMSKKKRHVNQIQQASRSHSDIHIQNIDTMEIKIIK